MFPSLDRKYVCVRGLGFGLLLLALPACGLSDYEALMRASRQREERFRNEQKYLDEPIKIPMVDKDGKQTPAANVFFRPPKGIGAKAEAEPRNGLMWRYPAHARGEFALVEMAFADANAENFVQEVLDNYRAEESFKAPPRDASVPFDAYEFNDAQYGYSINISKNIPNKIAIVFVFGKSKHAALRPAMDLSLQSLAAGTDVLEASQKYKKNSPWQLTPVR